VDIKETNKRVIEQFRAGGEIDGMRRDRLVLLTTVGAKSGLRRTTPMMFHRDGDRLLVIASNIGASRHPDWYVNLVAKPPGHRRGRRGELRRGGDSGGGRGARAAVGHAQGELPVLRRP